MPAFDTRAVSAAATNLVAFSGGPDSVCLLHLLLDAGYRDRLRAIHIDHGLDDQSAERARRAVYIAASMDVECRVESLALGAASHHGGVEAAAREARYARLQSLMSSGDHVLTAHHADDQVETVLLRLLRGAGPDGLAGMQPLRPLGQGWLGRPLLAWTRNRILEYLDEHRLDHIDDPANADLALDRNYLRHRVVPLIAARWPGYRPAVLRSARWQRAASHALAAGAEAAFGALTRVRGRTGERLLDLAGWLELDTEPALAVIRHWCRERGVAMPPTRRLGEFRSQCAEAAPDRQPCLDWRAGLIHAYRSRLWFDVKPLPPPDWQLEWPDRDCIEVPAGGTLEWRGGARSAFGARWRLGPPPEGARLKIAGDRPRQRVAELMRTAGIPPWRRHAFPALEIDGRLCAIGADWLDCEFSEQLENNGCRLEWHDRPAGLLI